MLVVQKQPAVAVCGNHGGDVSVFIVCEGVVFLREHHRGVEMCCDVGESCGDSVVFCCGLCSQMLSCALSCDQHPC